MKEVVTFFLSGKEYGVDVSNMQGIENYQEMSTPADLPECLKGLVTIRSELTPVIDIKKRLVLPPVPVTDETKYVVLRTQHGKCAFVADGVSRIIRVQGDGMQDFPQMMQSEGTSYVDFVARNEGHLILVINPEGLVSEEEWNVMKEAVENSKNGGEE